MEMLRVQYLLHVDATEAEARAETIAREQTVEVPRSAIADAFVENEILGRVEEVTADPQGGQRAVLAFPAATTAFDPSQLLNVMFGNTSMHSDVECVDVDFPPSLLLSMGGPRFGIGGLRRCVGVREGPLTCTAAKPMGLSPDALADLAATFARAGIDVVKDDHGLADHAFCPFEPRVKACLEALERVADETGHLALYVPNLNGSPDTVFRQLEVAQRLGARAVMASPMLIGLPVFWELCQQRASVPVLAHPAFSGSIRIAPELLFGKLYRLFGADAVIFLHHQSRFPVSEESCRTTAERLTGKWGDIETSLPVPAGGIELDTVADVLGFYGDEAMLLVGGSLQRDPSAVFERSREFVETVHAARTGGEHW